MKPRVGVRVARLHKLASFGAFFCLTSIWEVSSLKEPLFVPSLIGTRKQAQMRVDISRKVYYIQNLLGRRGGDFEAVFHIVVEMRWN
jgi:hypothetical protein